MIITTETETRTTSTLDFDGQKVHITTVLDSRGDLVSVTVSSPGCFDTVLTPDEARSLAKKWAALLGVPVEDPPEEAEPERVEARWATLPGDSVLVMWYERPPYKNYIATDGGAVFESWTSCTEMALLEGAARKEIEDYVRQNLVPGLVVLP